MRQDSSTDLMLHQIQLQLHALQISRKPTGISTAAEWVSSLRSEGVLSSRCQTLQLFLESRAVTWWIAARVAPFPSEGSTESLTCQPFVTAMIAAIMECDGRVYRKKRLRFPVIAAYEKDSKKGVVEFHSQATDGHTVVSFSGRKPDIPCYHGEKRGGCSITLLGDVKGCGSRSKDFPETEIGHILDMGNDLMTKEQFARETLYCFLTDGYRFQFFRCNRSQRGEEVKFEQSAVYGGERGWQVMCEIEAVQIDRLESSSHPLNCVN